MASPSEAWMREYSEAVRLSDEITTMVPDASSLPSTGPQTQRNFSASRRKITILKTKLKSLEFLMSQPAAGRPPITEKEMNKRKDMLRNVRSKVEQMANTLNSYSAASRDRLLGQDMKSDEVMKKAAEMDNDRLVRFQRQIMKEQDDGLEKLEETVVSTKHIALAVNVICRQDFWIPWMTMWTQQTPDYSGHWPCSTDPLKEGASVGVWYLL